tara:strand:- start:430 stop:2178 length:1749 start_codon:yes stop_codon:yes gene_type:complete
MSFNTFVLTGQKQKGWNEMKSKIEDKITNMYHNLDPSIKKMKHEDIAKHLQSKFLETEPNFLSAEPGGTGFFQGRRSMLLLIIMLLVYRAARAAAAYRETRDSRLLLTDGDDVANESYDNNGNDSLQQHTGQTFGQLLQIQRNSLLNRHIVRNVPKIMITFAESVGTLLQTFRMDKFIVSLGIEPSEMSETYLTNTIIPAVQNNWIGKADGIFFNDIDNDVEGSKVQRDTAIKMLGWTIQKALVYDEDFEKSIHDKDFEKAEELAREFTSVKMKRYQIYEPESDRAREQVKVCKDIVNRLKNGDQVVRWKEGFQLNYGDSLPIEKLIESESWGAIDTLQEQWMVEPYDQEEILKEATTGVWSIVISHIAWEITKNELLNTEQTASLANQMGAARENMEVQEVIIKDKAIAYLRKQTGALSSLKIAAVNAVFVEISQGLIQPIMDTLYVTIVGFRKVMAEEAEKSQADRLQNTIDSLVPSSTFSMMMSMIGSMTPGMVVTLLAGGVAASAASYVAWIFRKVFWKILKFPFEVAVMLRDRIRGTPTDYSGYTVPQLRALLGDRELPHLGNRAVLIQRLLTNDGF